MKRQSPFVKDKAKRYRIHKKLRDMGLEVHARQGLVLIPHSRREESRIEELTFLILNYGYNVQLTID